MTTTLRRSDDASADVSPVRASAQRWLPLMRPWLVMFVLLMAWITVLTPYGRYLDWDEAAFYGQSGGYDGVEVHRPYMAASREQGTPVIIEVLRVFARDLPTTRLLWTIVSLLVVIAGFAVAERWAGRRAGLVGVAVFATFWLPTFFFSSFQSPLMASGAALLTTGLYLLLREREPGAAVRLGLLLGMAAALMFSLRHLESLLVALIIVVHAVLWRPGWLVARWRGVVAAAVTFGVFFIVPWTLYTISEYGSVMARIAQARGQGHPFGPYNGLVLYGPALLGRTSFAVGYSPGSQPPLWTTIVVLAGMALVTIGTIVLLVRQLRSRPDSVERPDADAATFSGPRHTALVTVLCGATFGLFFFLSQSQRERYMMFGLIFAALLAGQVLTAGMRWLAGRLDRGREGRAHAASRSRRPALATVALLLAIVWFGAQVTLGHRIQSAAYRRTGQDQRVALIIDSIAKGQRCVLLGQAAKPQFVVATGCRSRGGRGSREVKPEDPLRDRLLNDNYRDDAWIFALWRPEVDNIGDIVEDWPSIDKPARHRGWVLSYRPPQT